MDKLIFVAKSQVKTVTFSKGSTIDLAPANGHNLEILSFDMHVVCDATVATRSLAMGSYTGAAGAGTRLFKPLSMTFAASDTKDFIGQSAQAGGAYTNACTFTEWIVPSGGSLHVNEANFVAGDTWTIAIVYRDIATDLMQ